MLRINANKLPQNSVNLFSPFAKKKTPFILEEKKNLTII